MSWLGKFVRRRNSDDDWIETLGDLASGLDRLFKAVGPIELGLLDVDMQVMTGQNRIADQEMYDAMGKVVKAAHETRMATVALLELSAKRADEREELSDGEE